MEGKRLGPYRILEQLGAGGMGEVWLAEDSRLGRRVAIKVLPAAVAADPERLQRFEQEARASAALNHPNIAVVHDVGADTDESGATIHYMVQEYLQGETLRDRIDRGPLKPREAVELGRQIANALAAAHGAGIVHRDLKPDNLFLVAPDHIKVLDFGLAKLTEAAAVGPVDATMSPTYVGTTVGQLLGTAGYMAPEQVRGEAVDHRADLFAFGCVLHEMLTGQRAFSGRSVHQTLDLILSEEPEAPAEPERALPPALEWIRRKCLAKEASRRYQHADELAVDLARFGDDLASGKIEAPQRTAAAVSADETPVGGGSGGVVAALLSPAGLVVVLAAAAVAVLVTLQFAAPADPPAAELVPLTAFSTWAGSPAISPDGRMMAFVAEEPQSVDAQIWVRTLPDGPPLQLTDTPGAKDMPAFSPDGSRIAYTVMGDEWQWDTWIVPIVGGQPRLMLRNANSLTWAPDGRVIYSEFRQGAQLAIVISDESGADRQDVWVPNVNQMAHFSHVSPDGSKVLIGYMGLGPYSRDGVACFVRDLDDPDAEVRVVGGGNKLCRFFARWSADGEWIYFAAPDGAWREPAGGGALEQVYAGDSINSTGGWTPFTPTPDGTLIVSVGTESRDIWLQEPEGLQRQLTYAGEASEPALSPDGGRLFYIAPSRGGEGPVWMFDRDIGRREQLCLGRVADGLTVSPDGRTLVLSSGDRGAGELWLCAVDGATPVREIGDPGQSRFGPLFSPDGGTVYYATAQADDAGQTAESLEAVSVWAAPVDGSEVRRIGASRSWAFPVSVSPDGEWISVSDASEAPRTTWLYPTGEQGEPRVALRGWDLYWSPDGSTWMFNNGGMVATTWILRNPDGRLLPADLPEVPTGAWFESVGARRVLVGGNFSRGAISNVPYEIAFERLTARSNLFRLDLPE